MEPEVSSVREGEELNLPSLREYLRGKLEGVERGLEVRQFTGGRSNLTYLIETGGREYVLRRAPLGPVAPKAHDMVREYRLLAQLHPHFPVVPKVEFLCEDAAVIGSPFYLMERRHGIVIRDTLPPEYTDLPDVATRASAACVDCFADLHTVDLETTGLKSLGKPEGFLERHLSGWIDRWYRAQTEPVPAMDRIVDYLKEGMPLSPKPGLIHNDYRLDNVMLDPRDPGRIVAVLDWEMATVGDPLVDLGLTLCYWLQRGLEEERRIEVFESGGWFGREEFLERYGERTGLDLSGIVWYEVFGHLKLAVIIQQIYYRFFHGQTRDQRFAVFPKRVRGLTQSALQLAGISG